MLARLVLGSALVIAASMIAACGVPATPVTSVLATSAPSWFRRRGCSPCRSRPESQPDLEHVDRLLHPLRRLRNRLAPLVTRLDRARLASHRSSRSPITGISNGPHRGLQPYRQACRPDRVRLPEPGRSRSGSAERRCWSSRRRRTSRAGRRAAIRRSTSVARRLAGCGSPERWREGPRLSSAVTGSNTCVTRHDTHRPRRGRSTPTPRTPRGRAHPHGVSTPGQAGHDTPPAANRDSTRT